MRILAIETSCDETAIALIEASGGLKWPQLKILKNLVASQIKIHAPFGGVVPNLAKREHLKNLPILFDEISKAKSYKLKVNLIVVTVGPGLEPALWTGINFAKKIHKKIKKLENEKIELIGVSHLEGHLYSFLLQQKTTNSKSKIKNLKFPAIALLVSGGHTILIKMDSLVKYKKIGETRDDAVGEAFDKVARLLDLPYPGGPEIEKLANKGNLNAINFPRPMINQKNYDFSFSGLKTAVLYYLRDAKNADTFEYRFAMQKMRMHSNTAKNNSHYPHLFVVSHQVADIAASFQAAAFDVLITKTLRAAKEFNAKSIIISGGVASNIFLRKYLKLKMKNEKLKMNFFVPPKKFCADNAAMIAIAGYINYLKGKKRRLIANGNLTI